MYAVYFYQQKDGKSPIIEFIQSVGKPLRIKIERQVAYLRRFGITKENPSLRKLTGTPLWEIRILGKDNTRIICAVVVHGKIFIVHIFKKKGNKTSLGDIDLALKRYKSLTSDI